MIFTACHTRGDFYFRGSHSISARSVLDIDRTSIIAKSELKFPYLFLTRDAEAEAQFKNAKRLEHDGAIVGRYRDQLALARRACWEKAKNIEMAYVKSGE